MPILELSSVSSMIMEAGAPAVPVAEVATEVNAVPDQRRWATAWWKYFHLEGQGIASLQRHVGVRGRRCQPTQHGVSGGLSPIVRRRDASVAGFLALGHCTRAMRQHASQRPLMMRHAQGQCSPAQVAAENREGASQRPLMMRRGAMLAGSGCG